MPQLIDPDNPTYKLCIPAMDKTHLQFIELVNRLGAADKTEFINLFDHLLKHTEAHFADETDLMKQFGFPAIREHMDEHLRILGELHRMGEQVRQGSLMFARAYVNEQLPTWFDLHAKTMDSALAAHLSRKAA